MVPGLAGVQAIGCFELWVKERGACIFTIYSQSAFTWEIDYLQLFSWEVFLYHVPSALALTCISPMLK